MNPCCCEGCDKKAFARGQCNSHWRRWKKHGDPLPAIIREPPRHQYPVPVERLYMFLRYEPETGNFYWKVKRPSGVLPGDLAGGRKTSGYIRIDIDGRAYGAHQLAWLYMHGVFPDRYVDHANRNPSDNRIDNLRLATNSQNVANSSLWASNTSGFKGVTWNRKSRKWQAGIKVSGRSLHLGLYDEPTEAHRAYVEAAKVHFGIFARAV